MELVVLQITTLYNIATFTSAVVLVLAVPVLASCGVQWTDVMTQWEWLNIEWNGRATNQPTIDDMSLNTSRHCSNPSSLHTKHPLWWISNFPASHCGWLCSVLLCLTWQQRHILWFVFVFALLRSILRKHNTKELINGRIVKGEYLLKEERKTYNRL